MGRWELQVGLVVSFWLGATGSALGAPAVGFPLVASQSSPVSGAVTIAAPAVLPEAGLRHVQFRVDGYVLEAADTTSPFQVVWSAASATDGDHVITAEAHYASGVMIESAPLPLRVANPATFNRTLHVDAGTGNDGNDGLTPGTAWSSLDRANAAAVAGDTVLLRGTFSGQYISPNVSGTAARPITFTSAPGQTAVLSGGRSGYGVWLAGRSYIVVERVRIQNIPEMAVLMESGAHHNVVRGSTITNIANASGVWGNAARIRQASDNLIEGNQISNVGNEGSNSGDAIIILDSHRTRILNNTMRNGGHSLIMVSSHVSTVISVDNVIAGNTMSNPWTTPLILSSMSVRNLVENNKISDGAINGVNFPRPGIQLNSNYNVIRYNEVFNNASSGLHMAGYVYEGWFNLDAIGNEIYHNVFYNNGQAAGYERGLWLSERDGRSVRDNFIANNIFFGNGGPYVIQIDHFHNGSSWPVGSLNGNRIQNNIFLRQPGSAGSASVMRHLPGGGNSTYTLNQFQQTYAGASGNLEADPMFTDAPRAVFTLRSGSPAIDRGLRLAGVPFLGTNPDLGVYEYEGAGSSDTTKPTVSLTAPTAGQTVSGVVTIRASASDNVGVTRIDYLQDGQVLAVTSPAASTLAWNTATVSNGSHTLSARAYDAAGNSATSASVTVTVDNPDVTPPAVTITSPTSNPTYTTSSASLTLGGTASDNLGVTQVTWTNDRGGNGTATGTTAWTVTGIVLKPGQNVLTVTARDAAGKTATDSLTVTFNDTTAPIVTITSPTSNTTYTTSDSSLTLGGTASDNLGVTQVTWTNDRGGNGTATGTTAWTVTGIVLQPGRNVLTVSVSDAAGNTATDSVTVTLTGAPVTFTDDPLAAENTLIKAAHIMELRVAIDNLRVAHGLAAFAWTDATLTPGVTPFRMLHLTELRAALSHVYQAAGRAVPTYTEGMIVARVTVIRASQLNEIRAAVRGL